MRIGEIAREAGVATSAVRYYERIGLLPRADRVSGRRAYDGTVLDRLALIGFAQSCGFRISEIRTLLEADTARVRGRQRWKPLAEAKLVELAEVEARTKAMRALLRETLRCNCVDIAACGRSIRRASRNISTATRRSPRRRPAPRRPRSR